MAPKYPEAQDVVVTAFSPSTQGDAAMKAAMREAASSRSDLVIASHAYPHPDGGFDCASGPDVLDAFNRVASDQPETVRRYLETIEPTVVTSRSRDIGDFLVHIAQLRGASLIVLALRQAGPIGRLSLGQAARRVMFTATCPVLIVKDAEPLPQ